MKMSVCYFNYMEGYGGVGTVINGQPVTGKTTVLVRYNILP